VVVQSGRLWGYGGADRGVHVYVHERIEQGKVEKGFLFRFEMGK
jgi:hypothetical protein